MSTKALITRSGGDAHTKMARASARSEADSLNLTVEDELPHASLVSGSAADLMALEKRGFRVKLLPDTNLIHIGPHTIDIEQAKPAKLQRGFAVASAEAVGWLHHLVQFIGPIQDDWTRAIEERGIDVVEPVGPYGVFVVGATATVEALRELPFVAWVGVFQPAWRIAGNLTGRKGRIKYVSILVYPDSESDAVLQALSDAGGLVVRDSPPSDHHGRYHRIIAELDAKHIKTIAAQRGVRWMEFASFEPGLDGERETQIVAENLDGAAAPNTAPITGYQAWLTTVGLNGNGVTLAVCDTGVDADANNNTVGHADLRGRQTAFVDYTTGGVTTDTDGHGTHVAGIAVGNAATGQTEGAAPNNFLWGQGMAPQANFVTQNALFGPWPPANFGTLTADAVTQGASVQNNSWWDGGPAGSGYTANSRRYDQLVRDPNGATPALEHLVIVFSAGNAGPGASTITPPKEAKNPIVVGNSLTFRPGVGGADDIRGIADSSSRGPALDGRILPNVVAPGTDVSSALSRTSFRAPIAGTGAPDPANPAQTINQYLRLSGTSMASPHVAGSCLLLTQSWRARTGGQNPSPALLKAWLINGAEDLFGGPDGVGGNLAHIPNNHQGWGRVSLENMLLQAPASDRGPRIFSNQRHAFTANGQEFTIRVAPVNAGQPMRITLVWTDAAGGAGANPALVNDLDLEVTETATGQVFRGNVFNNGFSVTGGAFDNRNNIECVYLQAPAGTYAVTVIAAAITASARPDIATPWQDFALVIENAEVPAAAPVSVVPVLDRSGSMIFYGYEAVTRQTSKQFVDLLGVDDAYGVVSFGDNGVVEYPPVAAPSLQTIVGQATRDAGKAEVDGVVFGGCTFMGDGIAKARDLLAAATTVAKAMVLFSDGYDNKGCDMANPAKPSALQAVATLPANLPVYTCAMGPSSDQALLNSVASATGGRYYFMPTIDDLFEIYNYIRGQVTGDAIVANESAMASSSRVSAFVDGAASEVTFTVAWANPALRFVPEQARKANEICVRLRDPAGRLLHPHDSSMRRNAGEGYVLFELGEPLAGQWFIEVSTAIETHTRYTAAAFVRSPIRIRLATPTLQLPAGKELVLALQAFDGGKQLSGVTARMTAVAPQMGVPGLMKKFKRQLADIRPPRLPKGDSIPKDIGQLMLLRDRLLKQGKPDLFASVSSTHRLTRATAAALTTAGFPAALATAGTMLGRFAATTEPGSVNLIVSASGSSPVSGTRFVRKELVSVLVR